MESPDFPDEPYCPDCGKVCERFAGNPMKWPVPLPDPKHPGKIRNHHMGCIVDRLKAADGWRCWHCGYLATNEVEARGHFGMTPYQPPECMVDKALREEEQGGNQ